MGHYENRSTLFKDMLGKIFTSVVEIGGGIRFSNDKDEYRLEHHQECCEESFLIDIVGDLKDLENSPILVSEESSSVRDVSRYTEKDRDLLNGEWFFYKFATIKGSVDVFWYGSSNGHYSIDAGLYKKKWVETR